MRGGVRIQGRYLSLLQVSSPLPPAAVRFEVPKGWLQSGERYVFQVMLEDVVGDRLQNRSLAFSDPYQTPKQATVK